MNSTIHLAFLKATDNKFGSTHQIEYKCDFERLKNLFHDILLITLLQERQLKSSLKKVCGPFELIRVKHAIAINKCQAHIFRQVPIYNGCYAPERAILRLKGIKMKYNQSVPRWCCVVVFLL